MALLKKNKAERDKNYYSKGISCQTGLGLLGRFDELGQLRFTVVRFFLCCIYIYGNDASLSGAHIFHKF